MEHMSITELVEVSHRYGRNPDYVLGGGGNTSWKSADTLFVKASGTSLGTIDESGFVALSLQEVRDILGQTFPDDSAAREAQVLSALMGARRPGQTMRPSVETILHALFPFSYVVHTHPAIVNGLLCSMDAEQSVYRLFGEDVLWVPYTTPGYILSKTLFDCFADRVKQGRPFPSIVFLQNHGIFVAADTIKKIDSQYAMVFDRIRHNIARDPDFSTQTYSTQNLAIPEGKANAAKDTVAALGDAIASAEATHIESPVAPIENPVVEFETNAEILRLGDSEASFAPLMGAFSPDHIVYAGARPLFVSLSTLSDTAIDSGEASGPATISGLSGISGLSAASMKKRLDAHLDTYIKKEGVRPRIVVIEKVGAFAIGKNAKAAHLAMCLFKDAVKVATYSQNFGGPHFMAQCDVDFIKKWEVEQYRSSVSA